MAQKLAGFAVLVQYPHERRYSRLPHILLGWSGLDENPGLCGVSPTAVFATREEAEALCRKMREEGKYEQYHVIEFHPLLEDT